MQLFNECVINFLFITNLEIYGITFPLKMIRITSNVETSTFSLKLCHLFHENENENINKNIMKKKNYDNYEDNAEENVDKEEKNMKKMFILNFR